MQGVQDIAFFPRLLAGGCASAFVVAAASASAWLPALALTVWLFAAPWLGRRARAPWPRRAHALLESALPPGLGLLAGVPLALAGGFVAMLALGNMALGGPRRCLDGVAAALLAGGAALAVAGMPPPATPIEAYAMLAVVGAFALTMPGLAYWQTLNLRAARERVREQAERHAAVAERLARYLPAQLHRVVMEGREDAGGARPARRAWLTVCFADVAGFTALTESAESEELTAMLDDLYAAIAEAAHAHGGTLDKFLGDAALVFFGHPDSQGRGGDAEACVRMASELRVRWAALRERWREQGVCRELRIRVGVDSGWCTVGTFGAGPRLEYTVIGTAVNVASRLEQQAAPDEVLLSRTTRALLGETAPRCRSLGPMSLRGLAEPLEAFALERPAEAPAEGVRFAFEGFALELDPERVDAAAAERALDSARRALEEGALPSCNAGRRAGRRPSRTVDAPGGAG